MNEDTYLKDNIKKCVDFAMSKDDKTKRKILTGMFEYNDYLLNDQLVVKVLNDKEKQEWFNNEMFDIKDKEIERLNNKLDGYEKEMDNLINARDKAIEYIEERYNGEVLTHTFDKCNVGELLEILDRERV